MTAIGGSIESISIRGRIYPVPADTDANVNLGGSKNTVEPNGDGSARIIKEKINWSIDGLAVEIDSKRGDQEALAEVANALDWVTITIDYASGMTYQGKGTIVDDIVYSTNKATATLKLGGPGKLTQQ